MLIYKRKKTMEGRAPTLKQVASQRKSCSKICRLLSHLHDGIAMITKVMLLLLFGLNRSCAESFCFIIIIIFKWQIGYPKDLFLSPTIRPFLNSVFFFSPTFSTLVSLISLQLYFLIFSPLIYSINRSL